MAHAKALYKAILSFELKGKGVSRKGATARR